MATLQNQFFGLLPVWIVPLSQSFKAKSSKSLQFKFCEWLESSSYDNNLEKWQSVRIF